MRSRFIFIALLSALTLSAQYRSQTSVNHYLTLSLEGAGAFSLGAMPESFHALPGVGGAAAVGYELSASRFIFGIGVGANILSSVNTHDPFTESYDRVTRDGDAVLYHYRYTSWREQHLTYQVRVPVYAGATIGRLGYLLAGATVGYTLGWRDNTTVRMSTAMESPLYPGLIENNLANYGYGIYPETDYASVVKNMPSMYLTVTPMVEGGVRLPLAQRLDARIGLWAGYHLPLSAAGGEKAGTLTDLSDVDISPLTQSQQNLAENIRFASLQTMMPASSLSRLMVGVRFTLRLQVSQPKHKCMCNGE